MSEPFTSSDPRPEDAQAIAVVGAGCRFPGGVRDLDGLWRVLADEVDVIGDVPPDRWDDTFHDSDRKAPGTTYCREGGFLADIDRFDAEHFGISPRDAREMDPQQRLLLEVTAEALEDAGGPRERWAGTRTSVHVGILGSDYLLLHAKTAGIGEVGPHFAAGKEFSFAAGRIAYLFGLHGPAMCVNTACSSSLVAVHLACQALRTGEADTAVAAGVNAILTPELTVFMGKVQALSPTGRCKPFDARADGIVRGEGCGVVVLKRYADALRDGDRIHGVIRGSAVNQDGYSAGLMAPNAVAQQALLRQALDRAGLPPEAVSYVEAHGTGTPLGDPLEISALTDVLGQGRPDSHRLVVGSHKANFGHMDSAAGIAGLLKALLVLRHRTAPPQLHHVSPSPLVDWERSGITVPTALTPLPVREGAEPVAGVSAFGLSGTNAHVLLTGPPATAPRPPREPGTGPRTLVLSAGGEAGLRELAGDYADTVDAAGDDPHRLDAVTATSAVRRTPLRHRLAVVGGDAAELTEALRAHRAGTAHPGALAGTAADEALPVVFVFSGQGSQWPGMGLDLHAAEPVFRERLDACAELIREHAGWSLADALADPDPERLRATGVAQPAVFALQVALAELLRSQGITPDAVIGHSMGEVAAACVAGALDLPDAVRLIVRRGQIMQRASGTGRMVSVELDPDAVREALADHPGVCVATVNGPRSVVVAGAPGPVERAVADLDARGATTVPLPVDYAFHSPLMRPYADELADALAGLAPQAPRVPFRSTVTPGRTVVPDAAYWAANVREPVLLWPAVDAELAGSDAAFVEIGAHPVLGRPLRAALAHRDRTGPVTGTCARDRDAVRELALTRARLHVGGARVDWAAAHPEPGPPVTLPPPRWSDERYWLPGVERGRQGGVAQPDAAGGPGGADDAAPAPAATAAPGAAGLRAELRLYDDRNRLVGELTGDVAARLAGAGSAVAPAAAPAPEAAPAPTAAPAMEGAPAPEAAPAGPAPAAEAGSAGRGTVAETVHRIVAEVLGHDAGKRLPRSRGFFELGLDSVSVAELARRVTETLGCALDAADVLTHASIDALTAHVLSLTPEPPPGPGASPVPEPAPQPSAATPPAATPGPHAVGPEPAAPRGPEPVAVVGIGCRLPGGVHDPQDFWRLLTARTDATGDVPADRWDAGALHAEGEGGSAEPGTVVTRRGAFLDAVDGFDHGFFRVSPRETRSMDPQQRLLLEVAWEALEDAGMPVPGLRGSRTGVFVGLNTTDYQQLVTRQNTDIDLYYGTGNSFSGAAGRLSYFLGTRGPSMAVDTACSSSLTAVHLACQSLRAGESEVAIAAGANVMSTPTVFLAMSAAGALAPDGRCKTFDDLADGYGRGEGAGAVILKPLSSALRDGDRVYAVIRGSAVNQDGASGGLTVPSGEAQQEVVRAALDQARIAPRDVGYVEAHGTGTRLGDAIEVRALAASLGADRPADAPLLVGSVKTNVGHLEAAAGITGLIKVALSLGHEEIPAHLHVDTPTRQLDWDRLPVRVTREPVAWPRTDRPRVAGVSAFGFTGTNAHVLLEEAPAAPVRPAAPGGPAAPNRPHLLTVSAATREALLATAARLGERLAGADGAELADVCWTAGARRTHHAHRLTVVGRSAEEMVGRLAAVRADESAPGTRLGTARPGEPGTLAFVHGTTAPDLPWGRLLAAGTARQDDPLAATLLGDPEAYRAFTAAVTGADAALRRHLGFSPVQVWEGAAPPPPSGSPEEAALTWAGQLAMGAVWAGLGVTPDAVIGTGVGELSAACTAGELDVEAAARLLAAGAQAPAPGKTGAVPRYSAGAGWPALAGQLAGDGVEVVLDLGTGSPAAQLLAAALEGRGAGTAVLSTPLHRRPAGDQRSTPDAADLLDLAGALHVRGCTVDFTRLAGGARRVVPLPGYAWQRRSHWITPLPAAEAPAAPAARTPAAPAAPATPAPASQAPASQAPAAPATPAVPVRPAPAAPEPARPEPVPATGPDVPPLVAEVTALPPERRTERLLDAVLAWADEVLGGADDIGPEQGFFELGMDSVLSQQLKRRAERELGRALPGTVMFECPNALAFARFIADELAPGAPGTASAPDTVTAPDAAAPQAESAPGAGTAPPGDLDDLDDLSDDALMARALSVLASSEAMLTEGDRS
ncbi:beta-ketoacyl synthase N-terminal-like domain-containing protein [Streptomyces sp. TRM 70351]|uniref:type I polyketide synthase n=1 Tax=Streptomyces sp. TRM 70351 TaxID=3116552 RepID=UPI002E7B8FA8|nr:beta-ketoacyl synthase N-terminal-like domain-containing protein [Streptomyces sp. TRM 70351]MEE1931086.1 beta-ketoacyl synthase N-terminal-like domain-containing protein [Streptomyces sp. TRM 70351]